MTGAAIKAFNARQRQWVRAKQFPNPGRTLAGV
jgi:hypothetical protein